MLVIEEDVHQNDYRLNTATPLKTFSIKHNNNKENMDIWATDDDDGIMTKSS